MPESERRVINLTVPFGHLATSSELKRMIGKTLGHYEILAPLGAGGMGAVY